MCAVGVRSSTGPGSTASASPLDANAPLSTNPAAPAGVAPHDLATGQEIAKTNAARWLAAGYKGGGVKVGIVDFFDDTAWNAAQAAGEVPVPAGTFCRQAGSDCDLWTALADHGEGVAEIIHEMAPEAQIYIATAITTADLQAAINYFASKGVQIVSRSLTAQYDGPGRRHGPDRPGRGQRRRAGHDVVQRGRQQRGQPGPPNLGSYWRGPWTDVDSDGWLEWAPGDELMALPCLGGRFINGSGWSDWGANRTNYDLYLFDDPSGPTLLSSGTGNQTAGALPIEVVTGNCTDTDYLGVHLASAGSGTAGDVLEFQVNGTGLEHWSNPNSAAVPAADSANAGALAIGAIDPATGVVIAPYSSWGPTNDARVKPDISAASCVTSFTYPSPSCFNGTSAATPVAAGAAAIVRGSGLATTPAAIKTYLLTNAFVDRGTAGTDDLYGVGELILPAPPGANTAPTISDIGDQSTPQDTAKGPIAFTVDDAQTGGSGVAVSGSSSNTALVPNGGIAFGGSGTSRTVTLTPLAGQAGSTTITVNASDGSLTAHDTFVLSVVAAACADDGREPDDSIATAQPVTSGVPVAGTACDDDYSALPVVAGQTINASLAFTNANGNLDLRLYGPTGALLGTSQGTTDRRAHHLRPRAGRHVLRAGLPVRRSREPQRLHAHGHRGGRDQADVVGPVADLGQHRRRARHAALPHLLGGDQPGDGHRRLAPPPGHHGGGAGERDRELRRRNPSREPAAGLAPGAGPPLHGVGGHGHPRPGRERVRRRLVVVHRHDRQEAADGVGEDARRPARPGHRGPRASRSRSPRRCGPRR